MPLAFLLMSQHRSRHLVFGLLLALSLVRLTPATAATPTPTGRGDSTRPRVMEAAASKLIAGTSPKVRTAAPAVTASSTPSSPQVRRQVFGYVNAGNLTDPKVGYTSWNLSDLTIVAYFGIHVNGDGTLASPSADSGRSIWDDANVQPAFLTTMHNAGVKVVLSIIQQDQSTLCSSLQNAQTTVTQTIAELRGADGVNLDYEGAADGKCNYGAGLDNLAKLFREQLPAASSNLSIATYAAAAEFPGGFFDIAGLNPYVDSFFVMAYDLDNYNYSMVPLNCSRYCFNPVGPAYGQPDDPNGYWYNDTRVAETYTKLLGSGSKVILGVPYYGWTACAQGTVGNAGSARPPANAYPDSTSPAWVNNDYVDAIANVTQSEPWITQLQQATDPWDAVQNQEPYATWWSPPPPASLSTSDPTYPYYHDCWRVMYWDDTTSLGRKYDVVNQFNLLGAGLFALDYGGGSPELWYDISSHFNCPSSPSLGSSWQMLTGSGTDVSPGAACTAFATGTDAVGGGHGIYYWDQAQWNWVGGGAVEIAQYAGQPWVVNSSNQIFYWNNGWNNLPGWARDIAIGTDGSVWIVGTNTTNGGYGLWRWESGGYWDMPYGGGGVHIAVDSSGQPWVVNSGHQIWHHTAQGWIQAPGSAYDIGAGGQGSVWVIGTNASTYGYGIWSWNGGGWSPVDGAAVAIGVAPSGMPWVINNQGAVYERV